MSVKAKLKGAKKSKTVWFATVVAILSVVQGYVLQLPIPPQVQTYVGMGIAIAIVLLRTVTTTALDSDEESEETEDDGLKNNQA